MLRADMSEGEKNEDAEHSSEAQAAKEVNVPRTDGDAGAGRAALREEAGRPEP